MRLLRNGPTCQFHLLTCILGFAPIKRTCTVQLGILTKADLACSRHGYMDQVKTRTTAKANKKGLKRRAGDDPLEATLETASVPATSGAHTSPMDVDDAVALLAPPPARLGRQ